MPKSKLTAEQFNERKATLEAQLSEHGSPVALAKANGCSTQSVYERMKRFGIKIERTLLKGEPSNFEAKKLWLESLLKEHGTPTKVAAFLGRSANAVRDRMKTYGISYTPEVLGGNTREERKAWLEAEIAKHGSIVKAAKANGRSFQSLCERAHRYGILAKKEEASNES